MSAPCRQQSAVTASVPYSRSSGASRPVAAPFLRRFASRRRAYAALARRAYEQRVAERLEALAVSQQEQVLPAVLREADSRVYYNTFARYAERYGLVRRLYEKLADLRDQVVVSAHRPHRLRRAAHVHEHEHGIVPRRGFGDAVVELQAGDVVDDVGAVFERGLRDRSARRVYRERHTRQLAPDCRDCGAHTLALLLRIGHLRHPPTPL